MARAMEALVAERGPGEAVHETVLGPLARPPEPVDPEQIVLHVGDRVTVSDLRSILSPTTTDEIDRAGLMLLPDLGRVRLAGLSRSSAEALLNERYREHYEGEVEIVIEVRSAYLE